MKTLVRYSRGQLKYTGQIPRESFSAWAGSADGRAALEQVASQMRFALFGRMRAAQRRVWRQLSRSARADAVHAVLQREAEAYLARLDTLAFAHELPYVSVELRRLVAVPRVIVHGEAFHRIEAQLLRQRAFATLEGGRSLRHWFVSNVVDAAAAAVAGAQPSPRRPAPAGQGWVTVGVNERFEWHVPFDGPAWHGHYLVLEVTPKPMTRAFRKAAAEAIAQLEASLPALSRLARSEILRQAGLSLEKLLASAPVRTTVSRSA